MTAEKSVITAFVDMRSRLDHPGIAVERWPDEENRDSSDIDAIAGALAIEHTSVDTVNNQRRDGAWFLQVVEPIEREFTAVPFRLQLTFDYGAVTKGQNWTAMRASIGSWIRQEATSLPDGRNLVRGFLDP